MTEISFTPIGVIHSPFSQPQGTPIQPGAAAGVSGTVELDPTYIEGLQGLDGFSHIMLLYHFHLAKTYQPHVKPFMDDAAHGLFATRAPARPNPIGVSVVELVRIDGATLHLRGVDIVDGTPLLDIKPFAPGFSGPANARIGWLAERITVLPETRDDGRFAED